MIQRINLKNEGFDLYNHHHFYDHHICVCTCMFISVAVHHNHHHNYFIVIFVFVFVFAIAFVFLFIFLFVYIQSRNTTSYMKLYFCLALTVIHASCHMRRESGCQVRRKNLWAQIATPLHCNTTRCTEHCTALNTTHCTLTQWLLHRLQPHCTLTQLTALKTSLNTTLAFAQIATPLH